VSCNSSSEGSNSTSDNTLYSVLLLAIYILFDHLRKHCGNKHKKEKERKENIKKKYKKYSKCFLDAMASSIVVWQAQLQVWQAQLQGAVRNRPSLPSLQEFYLQMACSGLWAVASWISTQ